MPNPKRDLEFEWLLCLASTLEGLQKAAPRNVSANSGPPQQDRSSLACGSQSTLNCFCQNC
jgi:hypothetical protein